MIWLPMVWTGLNEVIGSWKIIAISAPRISRISRAVRVELRQIDHLARAICPWRRGGGTGSRRRRSCRGGPTIRRIERAVMLLPQPLSPTMPEVSAAVDVEADAVDRLDGALVEGEVGLAGHRTSSQRRPLALRDGALTAGSSSSVRVGRVAQAVAQEVERQDREHHRRPAGSSSHGASATERMFWASWSSTPQRDRRGAARGRGS